jgi:hypothetical protein
MSLRMDAYDLPVRYPKPRNNAVLTVALTLCFGGLFVLLVVIASCVAVLFAGERTIVSNFTYLFAVLVYLGLIVGGLTASVFNLSLPRWTSPWQTMSSQRRQPVGRLLRAATTRASVPRSTSSAWLRLD